MIIFRRMIAGSPLAVGWKPDGRQVPTVAKKYMLLLYRSFISFTMILSFYSCSTSRVINLKISLNDSVYSCEKDTLRLSYQLTNTSKKHIKIPKEIIFHYRNEAIADVSYSFTKYNDSLKVFENFLGFTEYPNIREHEGFFYIKAGQNIFISGINVGAPFYEAGLYQIRLKFFIDRFNKGYKTAESNFLLFKIIEPCSLPGY